MSHAQSTPCVSVLIEQSTLSPRTKRNYASAWARWVAWADSAGVDPLDATVEDALSWASSLVGTASALTDTRKAISFVYRALGRASPVHDRRVVRHISSDPSRHVSIDGVSSAYRRSQLDRQWDYLRWCGSTGADPLRSDGEQVARFLRWLTAHGYLPSSLRTAAQGVSRYLEAAGQPGVSHHPAVVAAVHESIAADQSGAALEPRPLGASRLRMCGYLQEHWRAWCRAEGVDVGHPEPGDALRYLSGFGKQTSAPDRVFVLSQLYSGGANPFDSTEVLAWQRQRREAIRSGDRPASPDIRSGRQHLAALRMSRRTEPVEVPVGLTRDEVVDLEDSHLADYADSTLDGYWALFRLFEAWLDDRKPGLDLDDVTCWHIGAYLREIAFRQRMTSVSNAYHALRTLFGYLEVDPNPATDPMLHRYLTRLRRERREAPSQSAPFREADYQAVAATVDEPRAGERPRSRVLRPAVDMVALGLMLDCMLRGKEAVHVTWRHVSPSSDGSGSLLIPASKTDQYGRGEYAYVSHSTMRSLAHLEEVLRSLGRWNPAAPILGFGEDWLRLRILHACKVAGLEGTFGTHSMRIGMAQELAIAGFGLVLIMRAGRWDSPAMPVYYIRGLQVADSAVARFHKMLADGRRRVDHEMAGYDVLSSYQHVRLGD